MTFFGNQSDCSASIPDVREVSRTFQITDAHTIAQTGFDLRNPGGKVRNEISLGLPRTAQIELPYHTNIHAETLMIQMRKLFLRLLGNRIRRHRMDRHILGHIRAAFLQSAVFIGGTDRNDTDSRIDCFHRFQNIDQSDGIQLNCQLRLFPRQTDIRLSCHIDQNIRPVLRNKLQHLICIRNICRQNPFRRNQIAADDLISILRKFFTQI